MSQWVRRPQVVGILEHHGREAISQNAYLVRKRGADGSHYFRIDTIHPESLLQREEVLIHRTEFPCFSLAYLRPITSTISESGFVHGSAPSWLSPAWRRSSAGGWDAALLLEQSLNQLAETHDLDILCLYPFPTGQRDENAVKTICEEHSVVSFDRKLGD